MVTIRQGGFSKVSLLVEQTGGGPGDTTPAMAAPTVAPVPVPAPAAPLPTTAVPTRRR